MLYQLSYPSSVRKRHPRRMWWISVIILKEAVRVKSTLLGRKNPVLVRKNGVK